MRDPLRGEFFKWMLMNTNASMPQWDYFGLALIGPLSVKPCHGG